MIQLDLFDKNEMAVFMEEIKRIRESSDSSRRCLFARYNVLEKTVLDLEKKIIQLGVCAPP